MDVVRHVLKQYMHLSPTIPHALPLKPYYNEYQTVLQDIHAATEFSLPRSVLVPVNEFGRDWKDVTDSSENHVHWDGMGGTAQVFKDGNLHSLGMTMLSYFWDLIS